MKFKLSIVTVFAFTCAFCSCNFFHHRAASPSTEDVDIYIAGGIDTYAVYWKNGNLVRLSNIEGISHAYAIVVADTDVYVAGYESVPPYTHSWDNNKIRALYWKNGKPIYLTDGKSNAAATSIVVSGPNVYAAGYEENGKPNTGYHNKFNRVAKYWKNGIPILLTNGNQQATATAITTMGNDVFVAGTEEWAQGIDEARYWKNGRMEPLGLDTIIFKKNHRSEANGICVDKNNVYISGMISGLAVYWKNGVPVYLTHPVKQKQDEYIDQDDAVAHDIRIYKNDVYVSGTQDTVARLFIIAKLWKNGKGVSLTHPPDQAREKTAMAMLGKDIYLSNGSDDGNELVIRFWKNGAPGILVRGHSEATSIFVVKKPMLPAAQKVK